MGDIYDVLMVGAGPTSLTAAIYTTREDLKTVIYEKGVIGGIAATVDVIDNYPGFPDGIPGLELADRLQKQAERFGAEIRFGEVMSIARKGEYCEVETTDGIVKARSVLIGTGSGYRKLGVPGEEELYARGVHYCATCDGAFYRDKRLAVVGGGNSAVQEAMFLTRFASHIDLLVRSTIKASDILQHELQRYVDEGKITVHLGTTTDEIVGNDQGVNAVRGTRGGEVVDLEVDGVFVFVGLIPSTGFLQGSGIEFDELNFVEANDNLMTSLPGVFAAGDVRSGATMQIATGVGEGATVALRIREYLEGRL